MMGMRKGVRSLCVAYDIEAYSGHGTRRELAAQGQLAGLLDYAFSEAGLVAGSYQVQMQGDGGLALLPTSEGVDEPRLLVRLIRAFETGLAESNENLLTDRRLRLRLALHQGVVHQTAHGYAGSAVTEVCRIRDSSAVRDGLAGSAGYLAVAVADGLYRDVLADGPYGLAGSAFRQIRVECKKYRGTAWLYLPGGDGGTREAGTTWAEPADADHANAHGTTMTQVNQVSGGLLVGAQGGSAYIGANSEASGSSRERAAAQTRKGPRMPFEGEAATLAEVAAVALVTAMGTSGWSGIRDLVARLFQRATTERRKLIDSRLDDDASLVSGAADQAEARAAVCPFWQLTFKELLSTDPGIASGLAEIVRAYAKSASADDGTY